MDVAVPHSPPSLSDSTDLKRCTIGAFGLMTAASCGVNVIPSALSLIATFYIKGLRAIHESWNKELGLAEFRASIHQRDFLHAEELYDRHTAIGHLKGAQKLESLLVKIWTEEATQFLRMTELRGKVSREDIQQSFPRCLSREDPAEDVRLIVGAIKEISSSLFKESDRAILIEDLRATPLGRKALENLAATPLTVLEQHYYSFLE